MADDITLGIILSADATVLIEALTQVQSSVQETGDALASSFEEANAALEDEIEAPKIPAIEIPEIEIPEIEIPEIEIDAGPIEEAAEAMGELTDSAEEAEKDTKKLNSTGTEAGENLEKSFDGAGKAIDGAGKEVKKTSTELNAALSVAQSFSDVMGSLSGFVSDAIESYKTFNAALTEVSTLVDSAVVSNKELTESVYNLSITYGVDANATAKAMYQTISAGASAGADANKILAVAMETSIGGVTDVTTAVDGLTTIINAYGLTADDATTVADGMFTTMKNGKTTIGELSSYYSSAIPTAAALGVTFDELNAATVGMTLQGKSTAETMTSLNRVMASLVKPSDELNAIFNKLGYTTAESAIKQQGLGFALNAINDAAGGSVSKIGDLMGSIKASSVILSLTGDKAHYLTDAFEKMNNKAGASNEAFQKIANDTESLFDAQFVKLKTVILRFGEQAVVAILPFIEVMGAIMDKINQFAHDSPVAFQWITQGVTLISALAVGLGVASVAFAGFNAFIGIIIPLATSAISTITTLSIAMKGLVLSMGPIGLVVAGVAAGFAAMSYFAKQSEKDLEASHAQLKGMLGTAKNFNTAIDTLKNSEVVSDEVIQQVEAVKAAVMSGRMTEEEGMAIANQYLDQVKRRTDAEESMVTDLALKKDELSKLEQQQQKEVLAFRVNTALESINAEKASMNSGYDKHIAGITENLKKEVEQLKATGATTSEIAKVQAKAAQEILTAEQERATQSVALAEKVFQKKKELIEAEGGVDVAQRVYEAEKEFAQARIDVAQKTHDILIKNLKATEQEIEQYSDKIKSIEESIADEKISAEDKISKVRRRGMDEQQTQDAIAQQLAQRQAQLSGAFTSGDTEGAKNYTDSLIAVSKESKDTGLALDALNAAANEALNAGNTEEAKKLADAQSELGVNLKDNAQAEEVLQVASNIRVAAMEKEKASAMEAQKIAEERAAQERAAVEAQRVALEENTKALQTLTEGGESKLTISVQYDEAKAAIQEIEDKLAAMRDTTINITTKDSGDENSDKELANLEGLKRTYEANLAVAQQTKEMVKDLGDESANLEMQLRTDVAEKAIADIQSRIDAIKNTTINLDVKTTEAKAGGGVIGMAMGDVVPGVGDSDSVPALLTPGEYVVRKARSIQFRDLLNAINYGSDELLAQMMTIPKLNLGGLVDIPSFHLPTLRLAEGGFIPAMPQSTPQMPTESIRIDFSMGNQSGSLLASPAAEARKFTAMLREMKRGS